MPFVRHPAVDVTEARGDGLESDRGSVRARATSPFAPAEVDAKVLALSQCQ